MLEQPAFGQRLRALRLERGLSQAELAGGKLSTPFLSRLETGTRPPTSRVVALLVELLGVPASEFESLPGAESAAAGQASPVSLALAAAISGDGNDLAESVVTALRTGDSPDAAVRWQGLWLLAHARGRQGRHDEENALLRQVVELSDELGIPALRVRARIQLSRSALALGDNAAARRHAAEAHGAATDLSLADRAAALHALVSAETELGQLDDARTHADELCALTEPEGGTLLVEALWAAATVQIRQGDHVDAQALLERALLDLDPRQDLTMWIRLRLAAASLYLQVTPARTDRAGALLDDAAPVVQLVGTSQHQQQLLTLRAHLAFEEGRPADARAACAQIGEEPLLLPFRDQIRFQALCGRLRIADGDRDGGIQTLEQLARQAQEARYIDLAAEVWRLLAETLAAGPAADGQVRPGQKTRAAGGPATGRRRSRPG